MACWRSLVRRSAPYRPAPGDGGTPRALADFPRVLPGILTTSDKVPSAVRYRGGAYSEHLRGAGLDGVRHTQDEAAPRCPWYRHHRGGAVGSVALPCVLLEGATSSGTLPLALYLLVLLFSILPAYRVLMVWVYDRTGSLLVAILMHTSLLASTLIIIPLSHRGWPL